jgi:hypothetical protein
MVSVNWVGPPDGAVVWYCYLVAFAILVEPTRKIDDSHSPQPDQPAGSAVDMCVSPSQSITRTPLTERTVLGIVPRKAGAIYS